MSGLPAASGGGGGNSQLTDEFDSLVDPFGRDGWDSADPDIHIECLMPSGIVVPLDVLKDETLENIKQVYLLPCVRACGRARVRARVYVRACVCVRVCAHVSD